MIGPRDAALGVLSDLKTHILEPAKESLNGNDFEEFVKVLIEGINKEYGTQYINYDLDKVENEAANWARKAGCDQATQSCLTYKDCQTCQIERIKEIIKGGIIECQ